jgi:hypothetical protein
MLHFADSDEAGHASQFGSGRPYRNEAGHRTDLKPATPHWRYCSAGRRNDRFDFGSGQAHERLIDQR